MFALITFIVILAIIFIFRDELDLSKKFKALTDKLSAKFKQFKNKHFK